MSLPDYAVASKAIEDLAAEFLSFSTSSNTYYVVNWMRSRAHQIYAEGHLQESRKRLNDQ